MHSKVSLRYVFEEKENYPAEEFLGLQLSSGSLFLKLPRKGLSTKEGRRRKKPPAGFLC